MKKVFLSCSFAAIVSTCSPPGAGGGSSEMSIEEFTKKQLAAAQQRWPGTTRHQIDSGAILYRTKCIKCHGNYKLTNFSEERWKYELSRMIQLAKLKPDEIVQVTRYIFSLRDLEIKGHH